MEAIRRALEPQTKGFGDNLGRWGLAPVRPLAAGAVGCRREEVE